MKRMKAARWVVVARNATGLLLGGSTARNQPPGSRRLQACLSPTPCSDTLQAQPTAGSDLLDSVAMGEIRACWLSMTLGKLLNKPAPYSDYELRLLAVLTAGARGNEGQQQFVGQTAAALQGTRDAAAAQLPLGPVLSALIASKAAASEQLDALTAVCGALSLEQLLQVAGCTAAARATPAQQPMLLELMAAQLHSLLPELPELEVDDQVGSVASCLPHLLQCVGSRECASHT